MNKIRSISVASLLACSLFFGGCERRSNDENGCVLLKCGSATYSAVQFSDDVRKSVEATLHGFSKRKKSVDEKQHCQIEKSCRRSCLQSQLLYMLARETASGQNFVISSNALSKVRERYQKAVKDESIVAQFESLIERIAYFEDFVQSRYGDQFGVSEGDVENAWSNVLHVARVADQTNAVLMVTASNLVARVRNGEDFARLAAEYSQDENTDEDGFAPQSAYSDFDDERAGVKEAIMKLKVGDVTDPLDSDEGLCIYRLVEKTSTEDGEFTLRLQRISLHRMLKFDFESKNDVTVALRQEARERMCQTAISNMLSKCKIEFPSSFGAFTDSELRFLRLFSKDVPDVPEGKANGLGDIIQKAIQQRKGK